MFVFTFIPVTVPDVLLEIRPVFSIDAPTVVLSWPAVSELVCPILKPSWLILNASRPEAKKAKDNPVPSDF